MHPQLSSGSIHHTGLTWPACGRVVPPQEAREPVLLLVEQLCTGFHEKHDMAFLPAVSSDPDFSLEDAMGDHGQVPGSARAAPPPTNFVEPFPNANRS